MPVEDNIKLLRQPSLFTAASCVLQTKDMLARTRRRIYSNSPTPWLEIGRVLISARCQNTLFCHHKSTVSPETMGLFLMRAAAHSTLQRETVTLNKVLNMAPVFTWISIFNQS